MKGYRINIEEAAGQNPSFRKVLYTAKGMQLVLMRLGPNEEIGEEVHEDNDQFFRFESGEGRCIVDQTVHMVKDGDVLIVPRGARHNIINTSAETDLRMYTIYTPPHHKDGISRATKKEAEKMAAAFDGQTTE